MKLVHDNIDWQFLGMGSLLANAYLNNRFYSYGTIFESGPSTISSRPHFRWLIPFDDLSFTPINVVHALTEIGTMKIVWLLMPKYLETSLESISPHGSEKYLRKSLILNSLYRKYTIPSYPQALVSSEKKLKFGSYFTTDFVSFYIYKYMEDKIDMLYDNYPDEAKRIAKNLSLNLYERYAESILERIPYQFRDIYIANLQKAKITPYTPDDFYELGCVLGILKKYYSIHK